MLALLIVLLASSAAFGGTVVNVNPGDDLDAKANAAPAGSIIQVHGKTGTPLYVYSVDHSIILKSGTQIIGDTATVTSYGPANVPHPSVGIKGTYGTTQTTIFRSIGDGIRVAWLDLNATYTQKSINGIAGGPNQVMDHVVVHGAAASGIGQYRGSVLDSELYSNGTNPVKFNGTVAGVKSEYSGEVARSYVHNNPGNGIWCDVGCQTAPNQPNGWYVHDNVAANNGRHGIFYENTPKPSKNWGDETAKALIQNNYVYGSGKSDISISDSQNATVDSNVIGRTIAGQLAPSAKNVGVEFHSDGGLDRGIQKDAVVSNNSMNGEIMKGTGTDRDGTPNTGCNDNGNVCTNNN